MGETVGLNAVDGEDDEDVELLVDVVKLEGVGETSERVDEASERVDEASKVVVGTSEIDEDSAVDETSE